jgi:hypothetical protein
MNQKCREAGVGFFACHSYGLFGYIFCDLQHHQYTEQVTNIYTHHYLTNYLLENVKMLIKLILHIIHWIMYHWQKHSL